MEPSPIVTGISPNEGPPGTRIKIRGENFGSKPSDLTGLTVCGFDCFLSAEWKSPKKIVAIAGPIGGNVELIVTTRLGGRGTCNVDFKCHQETVDFMKESAAWVEEVHVEIPNMQQQIKKELLNNEYLTLYTPHKFVDVGDDDFSAGRFLMENYGHVSFRDLRTNLLYLRGEAEEKKKLQLSNLKANIGLVIDQADVLVNLKDIYERDLTEFGSDPTMKLEKSVYESDKKCRKFLDSLLGIRNNYKAYA